MADDPKPETVPEVPRQEAYPAFVGDDPDRQHRWDLCMAVAAQTLGLPLDSQKQRPAAQAMFFWDIET